MTRFVEYDPDSPFGYRLIMPDGFAEEIEFDEETMEFDPDVSLVIEPKRLESGLS